VKFLGAACGEWQLARERLEQCRSSEHHSYPFVSEFSEH
jgi:hypothetical protein